MMPAPTACPKEPRAKTSTTVKPAKQWTAHVVFIVQGVLQCMSMRASIFGLSGDEHRKWRVTAITACTRG
jgi:hypothetical protein